MIPTIFDDTDLMLARGKYSTLNAEHREIMKKLQMLTGSLSSVSAQVLHGVQPRDDSQAIDVSAVLSMGRGLLDEMERCVMRIAELAKQRAELKPIAWPR
jgi:hypothetical protein